MIREIEIGKIYRHFKGNLYLVLDLAEHTETGEKMVVYKALYENLKVYCRPLDMFLSKVDNQKYPNATQTYRFEEFMPEDLINVILNGIDIESVFNIKIEKLDLD